MENMRAVLVYQDAVLVVVVVRVAANVIAAVDQQHLLVELRSNPLGERAARKSRADNKPVYLHSLS